MTSIAAKLKFHRWRMPLMLLVVSGAAAAAWVALPRDQLLAALPYLLLVLCPAMHLFMHRGHHHSGHDAGSSTPKEIGAGSRPEAAPHVVAHHRATKP